MRPRTYLLLYLAVLLAALAAEGYCHAPAHAHSWYPERCCGGKDCAPVTKIEQVPEGRYVTSEFGRVLIPTDYKSMPSEDAQFHVCISAGEYGEVYPTCWFEPLGT